MQTETIVDKAMASGSAGPFTLILDRPVDAGGRPAWLSGDKWLHLTVAGCVSNDLFREAARQGLC